MRVAWIWSGVLAGAVIGMAAWTQSQEGEPVARPTTEIPRGGCVTTECHPGVKNYPVLHAPINVNACDACHTLSSAEKHTFAPTRAREEQCLFCHTVDTSDAVVIHDPIVKGDCASCHNPHGGTTPTMLRGGRYIDLCRSCHEGVAQAKAVVHGPAAAGACGACHEPHASKNRMLLSQDGRELCLRCHVNTGIAMDTLRNVHEPATGDCLLCHDPHASDYKAALVRDPQHLCLECHQNVAHMVESATTTHAAVTSERSCLNCHTGHASSHASLLQKDMMQLCFECHDRVITLPDGTQVANMKAIIEKGTSLHGPIAEHDCTSCHEIHGGGHRRLLTSEYPTEFYLPFAESEYALCFNCHDRQLVLLEKTSTVTGFRNGDVNLHFVHVNKDEKGRSCRVCHDAHASSQANHIRESIPFGPKGWPLPIKYQSKADGGGCAAGCHAALDYSRTNPVVYPKNPAGGDWRGEELVPGRRSDKP